jgi:hypothetical protein
MLADHDQRASGASKNLTRHLTDNGPKGLFPSISAAGIIFFGQAGWPSLQWTYCNAGIVGLLAMALHIALLQ